MRKILLLQFLLALCLIIQLSCASTQRLNTLEMDLSKLQRTYASTNFAIDSLSSKLNILEQQVRNQKEEIFKFTQH